MKHLYRGSAALGVLGLLLVSTALAQPAPSADNLRRLQGASAAQIIGARVRSADGNDIGEIEDLILSADAKVVTAVVSVGGVLDVADRLVAVPYDQLQVSADGDTLALGLTAAEIEAAPTYKADPPEVGHAEPIVDPARTAPPDRAVRREAEAEASRSFSGNDPRVAEGIAENKKAYEDEEKDEPQP